MAYDCKVATVTMEDDAVLTEREARKVIREAGYKVVSFEAGEPRKVTAYLFRVSPLDPDGRASLERGLREDLEDVDRIAVDSLGRATVVVSGDAAATPDAVSASLSKRGVAAVGFETKTWPKLEATYVLAVAGMDGADEARATSDALAGVAKVVVVHVDQDAGTATLWLKEPCDALAANVRAALAPAGFSVTRFERIAGGPGARNL